MPELPEVEVLAQHLRPLLCGKTIRAVSVRRARVSPPTSPPNSNARCAARSSPGCPGAGNIWSLNCAIRAGATPLTLVGHLGMTGRMYLSPRARHCPNTRRWSWIWAGNFLSSRTRAISVASPWMPVLVAHGPRTVERGFHCRRVRCGPRPFPPGHQSQIARSIRGGGGG